MARLHSEHRTVSTTGLLILVLTFALPSLAGAQSGTSGRDVAASVEALATRSAEPAISGSVAQAAASTAVAQNSQDQADRAPSLFENLRLFVGLDGSKQPQDLGINANMGVRLAVNAGVPLVRSHGVGVQVGAALNLSDAAVHVLDQVSSTSRRTQTFATIGVFQQRSAFGWALAYDHLHERYFDTFTLAQIRGEVSARVSGHDELGSGFTGPIRHATAMAPGAAVRLDPIGQLTGFERHEWASGAVTTIWAGAASRHHNVVLVFDDNSEDRHVVVYGARLDLPLNERLRITGSGNFLTPTATGTVDAYLGVTYSPHRRSSPSRSSFAPPIEVTNNPEFPVDLRR